jgi:predicted amino acid dehydrogenase
MPIRMYVSADRFDRNNKLVFFFYQIGVVNLLHFLYFSIKIPNVDSVDDKIQPVIDAVNRGFTVLFYPEGRLNFKEETSELKKGVFLLKQKLPQQLMLLCIFSFKDDLFGRLFVGKTIDESWNNLSQSDFLYKLRLLMDRISGFLNENHSFAFIIHPRNMRDVYKKFPFFKYLPKSIVRLILYNFPPIVVSEVTGLRTIKDSIPIKGYIISIPITAEVMDKNRSLTQDHIISAIKLAKKNGCSMAGLGGLISSYTMGGVSLVGKIDNIGITTGHAFTGYNVANNFFAVANYYGVNTSKEKVSIIGANGSVGSIVAKILVDRGVQEIVLIDVKGNSERINKLVDELYAINNKVKIHVSYNMNAIKDTRFIVTATNSKESLITKDLVLPGMVIIDDAQPSDIADDVLNMREVLCLEAGVVYTPGISPNFNIGLKSVNDNFCCMAELMCLSALEYKDNYVIFRANLMQTREMSKVAKSLNFRLGSFQNRKTLISDNFLHTFETFFKTWPSKNF